MAVTEVNDLTTSSCAYTDQSAADAPGGWLGVTAAVPFTNGTLSPRLIAAAAPGYLDGDRSLLCHIDTYSNLYH
ncbi:MAG: hypothetical protein IPN08_18065 [Bacteroidales bacterium]|nr:hypothetical protein [Bacteroidales bacterium]